MSIATVRTHHTPTVAALAAAFALAAAVAVGAVLTDARPFGGSSGAPDRVLPIEVPAAPLPVDVPAAPEWRIGSPDALERALTARNDVDAADPRLYGSPDAAERILGR